MIADILRDIQLIEPFEDLPKGARGTILDTFSSDQNVQNRSSSTSRSAACERCQCRSWWMAPAGYVKESVGIFGLGESGCPTRQSANSHSVWVSFRRDAAEMGYWQRSRLDPPSGCDVTGLQISAFRSVEAQAEAIDGRRLPAPT